MYPTDKFYSELAEKFYGLSLDSFHDEELGDGSCFGWFALFLEDYVIVQEDAYGFVYAAQYDSEECVKFAWDEISEEWQDYNSDVIYF